MSMTLDTHSPVPLHYQLQQQLRQLIEDSTWPVGHILPAEEDLASSLGISRATVRQAIGELVREGRLERRRNRGTRVTARPVHQNLEGFYSFAHSMAERGLEQHSRVMALCTLPVPPDVGASLQIQGESAMCLERLRYAAETPLILETCWFPQPIGAVLLSADLTTASIYDLLEKAGVAIARAHESIRPIVLDGRQAELLAVQKGAPAFFVERTSYGTGGPVELRRSVIRGDRFLYSVDLPRSLVARPDTLFSGERQ